MFKPKKSNPALQGLTAAANAPFRSSISAPATPPSSPPQEPKHKGPATEVSEDKKVAPGDHKEASKGKHVGKHPFKNFNGKHAAPFAKKGMAPEVDD